MVANANFLPFTFYECLLGTVFTNSLCLVEDKFVIEGVLDLPCRISVTFCQENMICSDFNCAMG